MGGDRLSVLTYMFLRMPKLKLYALKLYDKRLNLCKNSRMITNEQIKALSGRRDALRRYL
jgi:hypothetical protein